MAKMNQTDQDPINYDIRCDGDTQVIQIVRDSLDRCLQRLGIVPIQVLTVTCLDENSAEAFWAKRGSDLKGEVFPITQGGVVYLDDEYRIVVQVDDFTSADDHELSVPVAGCFVAHLLLTQIYPSDAQRLLDWLETRLGYVQGVLDWANCPEPDPDDRIMVLEALLAVVCTCDPLPDEEEDLENYGVGMTSLFAEATEIVRGVALKG